MIYSKTYSELITLNTFEERFRYLLLDGIVGEETFGSKRYLNQAFYRSNEWKSFRRDMIIRDHGCEMGLIGYDIPGVIILHHINPIEPEDLLNNLDLLLDPENTVCVSLKLHNAIHYKDFSVLEPAFYERVPGDTTLW